MGCSVFFRLRMYRHFAVSEPTQHLILPPQLGLAYMRYGHVSLFSPPTQSVNYYIK